jgi:hypothetical protein
MICSSVLSLPPWLAAMTPRLITAKRSAVMPSSRTMMSTVTQTGSSPITDKVISAAPVSALSAIGSAILPKSVTRPRLRASSPSSRSVSDAPPNAASAASRHPVPPAARHATKTGTRQMRATVSALATFISPGGATSTATPATPSPPELTALSAAGGRLSGAGTVTRGRPGPRLPTPPRAPPQGPQGPAGGPRAALSNRPRPVPGARPGLQTDRR